MLELEGKRLLVLGGTVSTYDVVSHAKELGAYVIVTDYLDGGVSKEIADESYTISTSDLDALEQLVISKQIDGIFTGCSEVNIRFVQELCARMKMPFYATPEQFAVSMNKKRFKEQCRKCGISVAEEYLAQNKEDLDKIREYPVIIKPTDGYASKGISICNDVEELREAFEHALQYSKTGEVVVEKYIQGYDDICMYYTIQDGNVTLSAMTDRDVNTQQEGKAPQPNALLFPSRHLDSYMKNLHENVKEFARSLQMQNGTMFIQAFVKGDEFIVFEMGYRLCGANEYVIVSKENEINTLDMYIQMALTGKFQGWDNTKYDNPYFKNKYCILIPLLKSGKIASCSCLDTIREMPEVIHVVQFYQDGEVVPEETMGSLVQSLARIYVYAENTEKLKQAIHKVQACLHVEDTDGNPMLLQGFDVDSYNWND